MVKGERNCKVKSEILNTFFCCSSTASCMFLDLRKFALTLLFVLRLRGVTVWSHRMLFTAIMRVKKLYSKKYSSCCMNRIIETSHLYIIQRIRMPLIVFFLWFTSFALHLWTSFTSLIGYVSVTVIQLSRTHNGAVSWSQIIPEAFHWQIQSLGVKSLGKVLDTVQLPQASIIWIPLILTFLT